MVQCLVLDWDVGWDAVEEIDVATGGANFGWPCYEGAARQAGYESKPTCQSLYAQGGTAVKDPLVSWPHNGGGAAAVGGPFTPANSPFPAAYHSGFFYADYAQNWIRFAKVDAGGNLVGSPTGFATGADGPVDLAFGADGNLYYVAIGAGEVRRIRSTGASGGPTTFLSDLSPSVAPVNGWGPVERDQSVGEAGVGDGGPLRINGVTYTKGLGTHAAADIRSTIPADCTLSAQVGIDDEVTSSTASVVFEVWNGTATRLYQSPGKRAVDAATAVSVSLGGVTNLRLVVGPAGDGVDYDHADWGDAKITCAP